MKEAQKRADATPRDDVSTRSNNYSNLSRNASANQNAKKAAKDLKDYEDPKEDVPLTEEDRLHNFRRVFYEICYLQKM